jgi:1-aminocyclopropane-1-carboxylate deaminase
MKITKEAVELAAKTIEPYIHRTPVLTSKSINELTGIDFYFKCENFQKIGAFKIRGGMNATLSLSPAQLKNGIATHSSGNHAQALAYAAKENNVKSIGYVRATKEDAITPSLQEALAYGMQLEFIGRTNFQEIKNDLLKKNQHRSIDNNSIYFIDEGGYGTIGAKGAATILNEHCKDYTTIIAAVGTGTMLAGLINAAEAHQAIIGIPVLKNEASIETEIKNLLKDSSKPFTLLHSFHQGGYAKTNPALFEFMNQLWTLEKIPTDIVYTGKLLWAVDSLLKENYFKEGSKILVIHSGGLQGNRSLPLGTLLY